MGVSEREREQLAQLAQILKGALTKIQQLLGQKC